MVLGEKWFDSVKMGENMQVKYLLDMQDYARTDAEITFEIFNSYLSRVFNLTNEEIFYHMLEVEKRIQHDRYAGDRGRGL
jgi:hypothetical protein